MLADIDVWAGDLYAGTLPQICVFTGQPTPGAHSARYSSTPRWTSVILLAGGILPFLLGSRFLTRTVTGTLPKGQAALRRFVVQRAATLAIVYLVPITCIVVGAIVGNSPGSDVGGWLIAAGFFLAACGFVVCSLWAGAISIAGFVEDRPGWGRWVRLRGVNPAFAAAVRRLYASRMPQWQMGTVPASFGGYPLPDGYAPAPGPSGWVPPGYGTPPAVPSVDY